MNPNMKYPRAAGVGSRRGRVRERGTVIRAVERSLGAVAAIGAAVAILMARSSTLVNREIAWTSRSAAEARALPRPVHFADSTALFAAVDRYVERQRREGRVPGLALALVHGDRIVHERGFGSADPAGRPVTPGTPFILGSMTKSFTALAVMQLAEQGRVVLDAPVQRYLPWFALRDSGVSGRITVRQLLNHTSGIPKSAGLEIVRSAEAKTLAQERRLLAGVRLTHAPGAVFEYSNANYWILGRILEAVTNTPYGAYVHEHIFTPLGMAHTYTSDRDARRDGLAQGYRVWFGFPQPEDLPYYERELAVGYLISTAHDMGRYLIAQLNGGSDGGAPVLSRAGLQVMHTPPEGSPYGMGWLTDVVAGVPVIWHTGAVANYHGDMLIIPSTGWGVVQLANVNNFVLEGQLSQGIDGIAALLLGYSPPPTKGLSFRTAYLLIALACLAFAAWRVAQLVGLRHWRGVAHRTDAAARPPRRVVGALIDPGISLGLLAGVPLLVTAPVSTLRWFVPDLTTWLLVNALASLAVLAARLAFALRTPGTRVPVAGPTGTPDPLVTAGSEPGRDRW